MFLGDLSLHGREAFVAQGYRTAAVCQSWSVQRSQGYWTLRAQVSRTDPFQLRQKALEFRTPRKGGYLCWPIQTISVVDTHLSATLLPPVC
jgi:hypothetical protein